MPKPKTGKLYGGKVRLSAGRKIDTWTYDSALPGQPSITVDVNLVSPSDGVYSFAAHIHGMRDTFEDKNLEELRKKVDTFLTGFCDDNSKLVWEDWLKVRVSGSNRGFSRIGKSAEHMSLSVDYEIIPRAELPDGRVVTMYETNNVIIPFPGSKRSVKELDSNKMIFDDDTHDGAEISYIKSTPEAIASLQSIQTRLNDLRNALSGLLCQDKILVELERFSTLPLLPSAKQD